MRLKQLKARYLELNRFASAQPGVIRETSKLAQASFEALPARMSGFPLRGDERGHFSPGRITKRVSAPNIYKLGQNQGIGTDFCPNT